MHSLTIISPSLSESPAFTIISVSSRQQSCFIVSNCFLTPSSVFLFLSFFSSNLYVSGKHGRFFIVQYFSPCGGGLYDSISASVNKCPKAHVTIYPFPSKKPSCFFIPPIAEQIFLARLGFSAIITTISFFLSKKVVYLLYYIFLFVTNIFFLIWLT